MRAARPAVPGDRPARRLFARAMVVLGGAIAGTAAAWALSCSASADELPSAGSLSDTAESATSAVQPAGQVTDQLSGAASATEQVVRQVAPSAELPVQSDAPAPAGVPNFDNVPHGFQDTVDSARQELRDGLQRAGEGLQDGLQKQLGDPLQPITKPVTEPLQPITEPIDVPVPGLDVAPPAADVPAPVEPRAPEVIGGPAPQHPQALGQPAPLPVHRAAPAPGSGHTHLGELPADSKPANSGEKRHTSLPLEIPSGSGSTGHDGSSSITHGPLAGAHLGVPLLPDPGQLGALWSHSDRLNVNLADQPGSTPD